MPFLDTTNVTRLVTDLRARFAAITHNHAAADITSGTLPIARGGTGLSSSPSMLTDLSSTTADTVLEASPRPGVTGTLAVANGGTGKATHTSNALLTGDGTSAVKNVATADGALYATAANGAAQFGTLPIAQGGTAGTTETEARTSLEVPVNSSIATVESTTATANHAEGDYFMLGDTLMCATTAIATGETISTSNATPATVQSQIDTLRDSVSWDLVQYTTESDMTLTTGSGTKGTNCVFIVNVNKSHTLATVKFNLVFSAITPSNNKLVIRIPNQAGITFPDKELGICMWTQNEASWESTIISADSNYFWISNRNWVGTLANRGSGYFRFYIPDSVIVL